MASSSAATTTTAAKRRTSSAALLADERLARRDFHDRLCLVRTPSSSLRAAPPPPDDAEDDDAAGLWPALRFDSHKELLERLAIDLAGCDGASKLKGSLTVEYARRAREARKARGGGGGGGGGGGAGVAYLLRGGPSGTTLLALIPRNDDSDEVAFDFSYRIDEMMAAEGPYAAPEFQDAFELALHRMEETVEATNSPSEGGRSRPRREVQMTTVGSAVKLFSEGAADERGGGSNASGEKVCSNVEYSPHRNKKFDAARRGKARAEEGKGASEEGAPSEEVESPPARRRRKSALRSSPKNDGEESACTTGAPVKTVEFLGKAVSSSPLTVTAKAASESPSGSPGKPYADDESQAELFRGDREEDERHDERSEERSERSREGAVSGGAGVSATSVKSVASAASTASFPRRKLSRRDVRTPWAGLWPHMRKAMGWKFLPGTGLHEWIYVHPASAHLKKAELLKRGTEGEDYFFDEEDVRRYARTEWGWVGEGGGASDERPSSPEDADLGGRVKKRKRGAARQRQQPQSKPQPKKQPKKQLKPEATDAKKRGRPKKAPAAATKGTKRAAAPAKRATAAKAASKPAPLRRDELSFPDSQPSGRDADGSDDDVESRFSEGMPGGGSPASPTPSELKEEEIEAARTSTKKAKASEEEESVEEEESDEEEEEEDCSEEEESESSVESSAASSEESSESPAKKKMAAKKGGSKKPTKKKQPATKNAKKRRHEEEKSECSTEDDGSSRSTSSDAKSTGDSASPSEESSLDATYQLLSDGDAFRLLGERFGFCSHSYQGKFYYCLPGAENKPGEGSSAVEGVHYFFAVAELRKHLCAYGLPELKSSKSLEEEERADLARWVRYAHVSGLPQGRTLHPDDFGDPLSQREAWSMLMKLGMKYNTNYVVPSADPSKPDAKFDRREDFERHLARFGIPKLEGIPQDEVLSKMDRRTLDLYIATGDKVDTFKRIDPVSENVNEVTPRRLRRRDKGSASVTAPMECFTAASTAHSRNTLKHREYQNKFNELLEKRRSMPVKLVSSQYALSLLCEHYDFRVVEHDGAEYFCLPGVNPTEDDDSKLGRDYFETVQDLREDLCAFGLPLLPKGSKLSDASSEDLVWWIRCATIGSLSGGGAAEVPECRTACMKPKEARNILKNLEYRFTKDFSTVVLPETKFDEGRDGVDQFHSVEDLFNNISRFGLAAGPESNVPKEERLELEIFVASIATNDLHKRIPDCDAPIRRRLPPNEKGGDAAAGSCAETMLNTEQQDEGQVAAAKFDTAAKSDTAATPQHPAVVVDEGDQDTPKPSPPKKARTGTITQFFTNVTTAARAVVATFSPTKKSPNRDASSPAAEADRKVAAKSSSPEISSPLDELSPSCLDNKGDDEVEAYFAETPKPSEETEAMKGTLANLSHEFATQPNHDEMLDDVKEPSSSQDIPAADHIPQARDPNMVWNGMWSDMKKSGWRHLIGDGLVAWYYIHPSAAKMKKRDIIRVCDEGVHYFTTEESVQQYAKEHLGWSGGARKESPPESSDASASSGSKKRKENVPSNADSASSPAKKLRALSAVSGEAGDSPNVPTQKPKDQGTSPLAKSPNGSKSRGDNASTGSISSRQKEFCAPPDKESIVEQKLVMCQLALHASFNKETSLSAVSSNEAKVRDFMTKSIETGTTVDGMTLPSPGFLYICGAPGTGKTTAVKLCKAEMMSWARRSGYGKPHFCILNMASFKAGKDGLLKAMLSKLAVALEIAKDSKLRTFENNFKKKVLVLILDEIDMLFNQHKGIGETWFKTLVSWAEDKEMRFSMIGISNCVTDRNANIVRELGHSPQEIIFPAYKEEQIISILEQRVGKHVVDHRALQLISRKVASQSGDVRRALEVTSNACAICQEGLSEDQLNAVVKEDDPRLPLVKLPHMMRAIRQGMPVPHTEIIDGLPQAAKVVLCIALSLSQDRGPLAEISISTLKYYCIEATQQGTMMDVEVGSVLGLVEMLVDAGLLVSGSTHFNPHDMDAKLKLGVQLDDVEIALGKTLLEEGGFYWRLANYIKGECRAGNP
ncbi:hypothetical protein ACHAWF_016382 [Thalassiosira exigua]